MTRTITLLLIIFSKNLFSFSPQISVLPSDTVGIGEEVYLSALSQSDYSSYIDYNFEWNFGDGYFLKRGENSNLNCDGGTSVTHFFMKPGVYTISLKIYSQNGSDSLFSNRKITVKGSEPVTGFECLHSDFHLKIAQPVYVKIPAQYRSSPEYRLNVSITSNGFNEEIFSKSNLSDEEMFILKNSTIPKGDYFFNIRIQNGSNKTFAEIKEPFKKNI
ncbi:MAG TPA: PKD domain-containing protein [Chitinispirillaceae bacterium]|nr:PKD domain-containing protein [Chitinispirillaceae bacterium]